MRLSLNKFFLHCTHRLYYTSDVIKSDKNIDLSMIRILCMCHNT